MGFKASVKKSYWWLRYTPMKVIFAKLVNWIKSKWLKFFLTAPKNVTAPKHNLPSELIVSLTSYPPRFANVKYTVLSILNSSVKPDKVILWIAEQDKLLLPKDIYDIQSELFEVRFCNDLGSYKKIVPTLSAYPKAFIVIADDDVYYPPFWLDTLINAWDGKMNTVVAHRVHRITLNNTGLLEQYQDWHFDINEQAQNALNIATGVGGVLYPPASLHPSVVNAETFMTLCPNGDDLWLYLMALMQKTHIFPTNTKIYIMPWAGSQEVSLANQNLNENENDRKFKKLLSYYKQNEVVQSQFKVINEQVEEL